MAGLTLVVPSSASGRSKFLSHDEVLPMVLVTALGESPRARSLCWSERLYAAKVVTVFKIHLRTTLGSGIRQEDGWASAESVG